jgi:protein-disulfide isomerase
MNIRPVAGFCLLGAALLFAQDWKTAAILPGVDLTGLTPTQKATVLRILRTQGCTCGCSMKMAQCRVEDPGCTNSRGLAGVIVDAIKSGKKENDALAAAAASKYTPKLLSPPVLIPTEGAPVTGPANARITLVEFSDFQCPYCAKAVGRIEAVLKAYPTQVRLIFKQFPLSNHPQASISAAAAVAAHQQGKFWEMHNALFANREKLSRKTILELAANLKLDMKRFTTDLDSPQVNEVVTRDAADGDKADVDSTPTVFINGQKYNGSLEFDAIKPVIDAELKTPKSSAAR